MRVHAIGGRDIVRIVATSDDALDTTTVRLTGDVDMEAAGDVLARLLAAGSAPTVVADLAGVDFLDSAGLRVLLEARSVLEADGRRLVVVAPSGPVRRVLQVTGMAGVFGVDLDVATGDESSGMRQLGPEP